MTFTEKLSTLIHDRGMSRRQFSEDTGISYSTIDNWYKRGYGNIALSTLCDICDYFGVTMDSMACDSKDIVYKSSMVGGHPLGPEDVAVLDYFWDVKSSGRDIIFHLVHGHYSEEQIQFIKTLNNQISELIDLPTPSQPVQLTKNEQELIGDYRRLNDTGKAKVREYAADLTEQEKYIKNTESLADMESA